MTEIPFVGDDADAVHDWELNRELTTLTPEDLDDRSGDDPAPVRDDGPGSVG